MKSLKCGLEVSVQYFKVKLVFFNGGPVADTERSENYTFNNMYCIVSESQQTLKGSKLDI